MPESTPTLNYKHRSFSQVKQLRECGYQFYLERIKRAPQRPGVPSVAGTATHAGTELIDHLIHVHGLEYLASTRDDSLALATGEALRLFDEEITRQHDENGWEEEDYKVYGFRPRMTFEWYRETGIPNTMTAYCDWRLQHPQFVLVEIPGFGPGVEVPFNYYIGDQLVHGAIDRVFMDTASEQPFVLDLKSGKPPATNEQLGLYAAALNKALGWNVQYGYYLYQLRKGEAKMTQPLSLAHWNDDTLGRVYLPATQLIDLGIFIPTPGSACEFCAVSESCEFAQAVV